jgi:hypothetical protein
MSTTSGHGPGGHEKTDVNVLAVTRLGLIIAGMTVASVFLMWFLFDRFAARENEASAKPAPMTQVNPLKEPPEPRLQKTPVTDLKVIRKDEDALINSYGWVDPDKQIVRIPVDRAMELVAKEGLPAAPAKAGAK